jgi:hypothetical protein
MNSTKIDSFFRLITTTHLSTQLDPFELKISVVEVLLCAKYHKNKNLKVHMLKKFVLVLNMKIN